MASAMFASLICSPNFLSALERPEKCVAGHSRSLVQLVALRAPITRIAHSKGKLTLSLFLGAENLAELIPRAAVPALQLQLRVRHTAFRARVDRNTRYESGKRQAAYVPRLLDDILAREIVTALLEHLLQDLSLLRTEQLIGVADVGARQVFREMLTVPFDAGVVGPFLVVRILCNRCRDDTHSLFRSGGDDGRRDGARNEVDQEQRLPTNLI